MCECSHPDLFLELIQLLGSVLRLAFPSHVALLPDFCNGESAAMEKFLNVEYRAVVSRVQRAHLRNVSQTCGIAKEAEALLWGFASSFGSFEAKT